ncbi:thiamine pyrophosphate-binding protein [Seonamhaeicola aphaedonensis]|uniref:2-succinyl-5-enolpyruvyl-6-hydroxy-3-cyclohexene-1-carboxylate synthase n=1 Tax=Seonamhaeicola aphaedonensis TaxID=1461338 RepID=A0A3D9HI51_9FLAO|nr:thiamine pyrophosphate-binding protein [Seonamhaeicola aphaedonensis]RED48941.1 2-succinyl-5-enolpyruvyl-6-hydroxy-3-cyclohexene-1-carboxylate synthase [Seonamhaeicola aphaedonensis]
MEKFYSNEKNALVVIALLKKHGVKKVVASPGTTNMTIVASMQSDNYFEVFSSVDERSAAYMACGLAGETKEPVVICCTGATASRNYLPGLTEAYYRKLPIIAITATPETYKVGHHVAQVIDRSVLPNDVSKLSLTLPIIKDDNDLIDCEIKVNRIILESFRHGGGPVHLNFQTTYNSEYTTKELPDVRVINRIRQNDEFPELPNGKIGIFIGVHQLMTDHETKVIDDFCAANNAAVFCDHTSGYKGNYRLLYSIASSQIIGDPIAFNPDVLIHIGEVSGDYSNLRISGKQIWRVNEDGEIRDTFGKLRYVFEMPEQSFFENYTNNKKGTKQNDFFNSCKIRLESFYNRIPDIPFSNIWVASKLSKFLPEKSCIHFGILNSLRSWNFFEISNTINSISSVGGFGIDGNISTLLGASLSNKNKLFYGVVGDLAFFYDMNSLGNRHFGNNIRILLINNGKGTEFRNFNHKAAHFGIEADKYIAAAGHFGNKSEVLVKNYAENLGFEYFAASNKEQFENVYNRFLEPKITDKPMLFEVFTDSDDESKALEMMVNIDKDTSQSVKKIAKQVLGENRLKALKKALKK